MHQYSNISNNFYRPLALRIPAEVSNFIIYYFPDRFIKYIEQTILINIPTWKQRHQITIILNANLLHIAYSMSLKNRFPSFISIHSHC